ncbi:hypothetical protein, partial [Lutibacter sp.]|uniref:hypothetical protein n=1 Tax=Lutibacter sp. TaxID=1925666 RepID=UPI003567168A
TTKKMVTRGFNLLYESDDEDLSEDKRIQDKYKSDKSKLSNYEKELDDLKIKINNYKNNQRVTTVNKVIDGFDLSMSFKAIKEAVRNLIERIDVEYIPLTKNGRFIFKIKYKGFDETIEFVSTQKLDRFALHKYNRAIDPADYSEGSKLHSRITTLTNFLREHESHSKFNEFFDRFSKNEEFHIRLSKDELLYFV